MGAYGIRRTAPLWLLIIASQLPDWADAFVCTMDIASPVPGFYSHSFTAIGLMGVAGFAVAYILCRDVAGSLLVAALVVSHAFGDYVTGLKPTWAGGPMIGLQLYSRPALDFVFETLVLVAGWVVYQRSFPPERRYSRDLIMLLFVLIAIQAGGNIVMSLVPGMKKC
jgi:hypothetical protein